MCQTLSEDDPFLYIVSKRAISYFVTPEEEFNPFSHGLADQLLEIGGGGLKGPP